MTLKAPTLAATMTPFPYSVPPEATLEEARGMMEEHDFHHLPVTDGGDIVGAIARADLLLAENLAPGGLKETLVKAAFTPEPYVVDIHTGLAEVAATMAEERLGSAIVTRHGKLAGILTHTDVCRALAEMIHRLEPPPPEEKVPA